MQTDGGEGKWKVPRISSSLFSQKTEIEGGDGFGIWRILYVHLGQWAKLMVICSVDIYSRLARQDLKICFSGVCVF